MLLPQMLLSVYLLPRSSLTLVHLPATCCLPFPLVMQPHQNPTVAAPLPHLIPAVTANIQNSQPLHRKPQEYLQSRDNFCPMSADHGLLMVGRFLSRSHCLISQLMEAIACVQFCVLESTALEGQKVGSIVEQPNRSIQYYQKHG